MGRIAAIALLAGALLATEASAARPEPVRHGPACTPAGCSGRSGSPLGLLAGFGLVTLAMLQRGRRADEGSAAR